MSYVVFLFGQLLLGATGHKCSSVIYDGSFVIHLARHLGILTDEVMGGLTVIPTSISLHIDMSALCSMLMLAPRLPLHLLYPPPGLPALPQPMSPFVTTSLHLDPMPPPPTFIPSLSTFIDPQPSLATQLHSISTHLHTMASQLLLITMSFPSFPPIYIYLPFHHPPPIITITITPPTLTPIPSPLPTHLGPSSTTPIPSYPKISSSKAYMDNTEFIETLGLIDDPMISSTHPKHHPTTVASPSIDTHTLVVVCSSTPSSSCFHHLSSPPLSAPP